MIQINHLKFKYRGGCEALKEVDTTIGPGIHLLLGENGAGKTTFLRLLAGLLRPTSGTILIDNENVSMRRPSVMSRLFLLADNTLFPAKTVNKFAETFGCFYPRFSAEMLAENLASFGLNGDEKIEKLSLGNRRKAMIAFALALRTEYLFLDEPANGLDISSKQILQNMLACCIDETQTVIISTHTVWNLENLFESVMMVRRGEMIFNSFVDRIIDRIRFVASPYPPAESLFTEKSMGLFRSISLRGDDEETNIDYTLLYNALQSEHSAEIVQLINKEDYR